jgi:hypothetical protein
MLKRSLTSLIEEAKHAIVVVLLIVVILSIVPMVSAQLQSPVANIVRVESPTHVMRGERFAVTLSIEFRDAQSADIAVSDALTHFVLASKDLFIPMPTGVTSFSFQVLARDQPGTWRLLASVRTWWHNGWFANQNGGTVSFEIEVVELGPGIIRIASNLRRTEVKIDDVPYTITQDGIQLQVARGIHTFHVEPELILDNGTRAVFDHWSDGVTASPRSIYLEQKLDLSAIYATQYFLLVQSDFGQTIGSGWYPAGMTVTFAALDPALTEEFPINVGTSYRFSHWSGDSESASSVSWVVMDRPKMVVAHWSEDTAETTFSSILKISVVLLFGSFVLIVIGGVLRRKLSISAHQGILEMANGRKRSLFVLALLAVIVLHAPSFPEAHALDSFEPESITIGNALWHHWTAAASDTCLIWLGGGIVGQSGLTVNPYEYESFNTMRFVQDLANHYDVLALEKGSVASVDAALNRTMFVEPYPSRVSFIKNIRAWANAQGYVYLYVIGYSVGALAAAKELTLADPENWVTPNGLVLITPQIPEGTSSKAHNLQASLLVLYGGGMPQEFIASGERYFQNAPAEGWLGDQWYHKEYHVVSGTQHEVWTNWESGEYDSRAALLTLSFIEASKSLQFEREKARISKLVSNATGMTELSDELDVHIHEVLSPKKVRTGEVFKATTTVQYSLPTNRSVAVVAFDVDRESIAAASVRQLSGTGERQFDAIIMAREEDGHQHLALVLLIRSGNDWALSKQEMKELYVQVTNAIVLTLSLGYPDIQIELDSRTYRTQTDGKLTADVTAGKHTISAPSMISLSDASRAIFRQWNATSSSPTLVLNLSSDTCLVAVYQRQHYLAVTSPFGLTTGTGWHDENSTVAFQVTPPIVEDDRTHLFMGWSGDSRDPSPASYIFMNAPKNVSAEWKDLNPDRRDHPSQQWLLLTFASVILTFALIFLGYQLASRRRISLRIPQDVTVATGR